MTQLKEHLEKSRTRLKKSESGINRKIIECLTDIHIAMTAISGEMDSMSEKWDNDLDEKSKYLEARAKHFVETTLGDMYDLANDVSESKEGMVELETALKRWQKTVLELSDEVRSKPEPTGEPEK